MFAVDITECRCPLKSSKTIAHKKVRQLTNSSKHDDYYEEIKDIPATPPE